MAVSGVEFRAGASGMDAPVREQVRHGAFTHRIIALGNQLMQIEQADSLSFRNLPRPIGVAIEWAGDLAVLPDVARDERTDDRRRAFGTSLGNVLAQVPPIGVDGFPRAAVSALTAAPSTVFPGRLASMKSSLTSDFSTP